MFLKSNRKKRIVLTGGGTGGHIFPLIAISRELKQISASQRIPLEIIYLGPKDFTFDYILKENIIAKSIFVGKLKPEFSFSAILDILKSFVGIIQSFFYLYFYMPDAVVVKGGYGSFPVAFWSVIMFIPLYLHESDSVPGSVNSLFKRFAKKIFLSFQYSLKYFPKEKSVLTGNPVRRELFNLPEKESTKKLLKLSSRPILTIVGGSQGSMHLNDFVLDCLDKLLEKVEIIHQTGKNNYEQVLKETKIIYQEIIKDKEKQIYYHPVPFFEEKEIPDISSWRDVLAATDLIVSRAGSGLIFEIAAAGIPSILVPLPWASKDHQRKNAYEYGKNGAGVVLEEENLKPNIFSDLIFQIIFDEERKKQMKNAALAFSKPSAALIISQIIIKDIISF